MNFIEACRKAISIESTPASGSRELALWLAEYCRSKGLFVDLQFEYSSDREEANIIIRAQQERPENEFLLQAHLDTPDPGPFQLWNKNGQNPFDATIEDGCIYGLGSAEVKLDILCKIEALIKNRDRGVFKLPPVVVGTFGEETGMVGALKLIRKNRISTKMALVAEPSNLKIVNAAKGFASVEIRVPFSAAEVQYREEHNLRESTSTQSKLFTGKAAHSSTPHLGESAIRKMFEHILMLPDSVNIMEADGGTNFNTVPSHAFLELDIGDTISDSMASKLSAIYRALRALEAEFVRYVDAAFNPSVATLNIGLVRTFEDHILIAGNCRIPPAVSQEVYESWMDRLNKECQAVGANFRIVDYKKPFRTDDKCMLIRACKDELRAMGLSDQIETQASTNEASIFSRVGIDCVCFGPGLRQDNTHTPQEHVKVVDLEKAIEFYDRIIGRICL